MAMIINRVKRLIKRHKWTSLFIAGLFLLCLKTELTSRSINKLADLDKCPTCYGYSACHFINDVEIDLNDFYSLFAAFLGVKNVYFGNYKEQKIVLKKLAHNSELYDFDKMICEDEVLSEICPKHFKIRQESIFEVNFHKFVDEEIRQDSAKDFEKRLILCPTTENFDELFANVYENNKNVHSRILNINLWTTLKINPEPLILQILPAEEGWPVPRYFGSCGRIIVEEYVGPSLNSFYEKPWMQRAKISASLLKAARDLTFRGDFAFYLTDISPDNIAVNEENVGKFVDLENVIVVDKNFTGLNSQELQENRIVPICSENFNFSAKEICRHRISDHNYYAICQILWVPEGCGKSTSGFLHDVPKFLRKLFPQLEFLLDQCVLPDLPENRISIGDKLEKLLRVISDDEKSIK